MISILVTGADGQLGSAIRKLSANSTEYTFTFLDIHDLDLTKVMMVAEYLRSNHFDYIINCAAYTAVDQAEKDSEKAFSINASVPAQLGKMCAQGTSRLIHLSTDYVYNGNVCMPHLEEEIPVATSVYAKSKLEGERALWSNPAALVIRTSWLYSEFGNNFMKTMIRLSKERSEIQVVFDQVGTPTYAGDLALTILHMITYSGHHGFRGGIYNFSNEGVCSWYDFAKCIMELTGSSCTVKPIRTSEFPQPAKRPEYSVLDKNKIKRTFGLNIPYWRDSLKSAIQNLKTDSAL